MLWVLALPRQYVLITLGDFDFLIVIFTNKALQCRMIAVYVEAYDR